MKTITFFLLIITLSGYSQNKPNDILGFKGDHYVFYNKCKSTVTFCELTQQSYTFCGSIKNCYGLYVLPGDTFYVNIEDKNQIQEISADISFSGYFPSVTNFTFQPIVNCIPPQALQITIPLSAVAGSSFQIIAQNTAYVTSPTLNAGVPEPYNIYIGGTQPINTIALANFTSCPEPMDVSVNETVLTNSSITIHPNPSSHTINLKLNDFRKALNFKLFNIQGSVLKSDIIEKNNTELLISDLQVGLYFISIYSEKVLIATEKLIVTSSEN